MKPLTLSATRARLANATVVISDDVETVGEQIVGEAQVVAAANRGGGVDDDTGRAASLTGMSPSEAAKDEAVCGGLLERFARSGGWQRQLNLSRCQ